MFNRIRLLASLSVFIFITGQAAAESFLSELPIIRFPKHIENSRLAYPPGRLAEADIAAQGVSGESVSLLLNVGEGYRNDEIRIINTDGDGKFDQFECLVGSRQPWGRYTPLDNAITTPFQSAHMRVEKIASSSYITLTNIDHGNLEDQKYECHYGPYPEGHNIGIGAGAGASIDNFSDGKVIRDSFAGSGPLSDSANWKDLVPGLYMENGVALAGAYPNISAIWVGARDVGGALQGMDVRQVLCVNQTTGDRVIAPPTYDAWDCENSGLKVTPGAQIMQIGVGTAH